MARRPPLSDTSFLNAIFHPKTAQRPTGIRKSSASINSKRKASRVKAFNNLDPLKQQIIIRAGNKESYLRGASTLNESRQQLRPEAVSKGIARPLTPSSVAIAAIVGAAQDRNQIDDSGKLKAPISINRVAKNVHRMTRSQKAKAERISSYQELMDLIDEYADDDDNPFFYK